MKKGMLIAFSILLMLALIGGSAYSQTTVTVWVYDELGEEGRPLYEATQEFMEENPDIVINLQNQPHRGLMQSFITASMAGAGPDIIHTATTWPVELAAMGHLEPLDDYLEESNMSEKLITSGLESARYMGKIYAAPWRSDATALIYNQDLFEESGLELPSKEEPFTWDEFRRKAEIITEETDSYGFGIRSARGASYTWFPFLYANEGVLLNEEWTEVKFNSPEGHEAFQFLTDMYEDGIIPEAAVAYDTWDDIRHAFLGGRIAMYIAGDWEVAPLRAAEPDFNWSVAPHPMQKRRATSLGGGSLGISSDSDVKDEAWQYMEFLLHEDNMWVMFEEGFFPSHVNAPDSEYVDDPIYEVFIREFPYGINHASIVGDQIRTAVGEAFDEVMVEGRDPEEALNDAAQRIQEELDMMQ